MRMLLIPLLGATLSASSLGQTLATSASPTNKVVQLVLPHSAPLAFVGGSGAAGTNAAVVLAEFVEAGFTHSWAAFTGLPDDQVMLDAASAAGVKIIAKQQAKPVSAVDVARRFKNHPALAGYMLMDEPSTADFPALAKMAREVLALDAEKLVLVNLYPTYATKEQLGIKPYAEYSDYVYKFLSEVPVNLLSYDFYPIMRLELLPDWHQNLNVGYEAARKCKIPLWVWIASAGMELTPDPTIGSLRLQAYNNLAYGATGIEHFTYRNHSWMRAACIERDSSRSPTFDLVKQLHRELQAQARVFVGSTIQRVGFAGNHPPPKTHSLEALRRHHGPRGGQQGCGREPAQEGQPSFSGDRQSGLPRFHAAVAWMETGLACRDSSEGRRGANVGSQLTSDPGWPWRRSYPDVGSACKTGQHSLIVSRNAARP